jgi:hypothetical protein
VISEISPSVSPHGLDPSSRPTDHSTRALFVQRPSPAAAERRVPASGLPFCSGVRRALVLCARSALDSAVRSVFRGFVQLWSTRRGFLLLVDSRAGSPSLVINQVGRSQVLSSRYVYTNRSPQTHAAHTIKYHTKPHILEKPPAKHRSSSMHTPLRDDLRERHPDLEPSNVQLLVLQLHLLFF